MRCGQNSSCGPRNCGPVSYCLDPYCVQCRQRTPRREYSETYSNIDLQSVSDVITERQSYLEGYFIANRSSVEIFIKIYDKVGSPIDPLVDVPLIVIPLQQKLEANISYKKAPIFRRGMQIRACLGVANNDQVAPATNDVVVDIFYT